jgi:hypothetical protein
MCSLGVHASVARPGWRDPVNVLDSALGGLV